MTDALNRTLARINRLRAARNGRVVDLERVRLQRELKALPGRLGPEGWQGFLQELVTALANRIPRPPVELVDQDRSDDEADHPDHADAGDDLEGGNSNGA